jgi:hypothetical protein
VEQNCARFGPTTPKHLARVVPPHQVVSLSRVPPTIRPKRGVLSVIGDLQYLVASEYLQDRAHLASQVFICDNYCRGAVFCATSSIGVWMKQPQPPCSPFGFDPAPSARRHMKNPCKERARHFVLALHARRSLRSAQVVDDHTWEIGNPTSIAGNRQLRRWSACEGSVSNHRSASKCSYWNMQSVDPAEARRRAPKVTRRARAGEP